MSKSVLNKPLIAAANVLNQCRYRNQINITDYHSERHTFLVAGARTCNDLPVDVTSAPSLLT